MYLYSIPLERRTALNDLFFLLSLSMEMVCIILTLRQASLHFILTLRQASLHFILIQRQDHNSVFRSQCGGMYAYYNSSCRHPFSPDFNILVLISDTY
jgi:hypothetical protein